MDRTIENLIMNMEVQEQALKREADVEAWQESRAQQISAVAGLTKAVYGEQYQVKRVGPWFVPVGRGDKRRDAVLPATTEEMAWFHLALYILDKEEQK